MSDSVLLTVKVPRSIKTQAQKLAKDIGLPLGTIVNRQLVQFINDKSITFEPLVPNKKTAASLRRTLKDIKAGKNISATLHNPEEVKAYFEKFM
jgi:antitoxin component of RelBE/YafQ-DinJ toxin-antitoxin module